MAKEKEQNNVSIQLTHEQEKIVQESWEHMKPIYSRAAEIFYEKLFALDEDIERMSDGLDMAIQGHKLMTMIGLTVEKIDTISDLVPAFRSLGLAHLDYGVKVEHYDAVSEAFLGTLADCIGDEFTAEVRACWVITYNIIADAMKDGAY